MKIDPQKAGLIAAFIGLVGTLSASVLAQWGNTVLEDKRNRAEILLDIIKTSDKKEALQKLRILKEAGLFPDKDGKLEGAIDGTDPLVFKADQVDIPIAIPCIDARDIPAKMPKIGHQLNGDAVHDTSVLAQRILKLTSENEKMRALLAGCSK